MNKIVGDNILYYPHFIFLDEVRLIFILEKVLDISGKSDIIDTVRKTTVNPYNNFEWRLKK